MTGLDKIIEQIRQETEQAAQEQIRQGREEAEKILEEEKRRALEQSGRIDRKARQEADGLAARMQSATALECRKRMLKAKQLLIGEVIDAARQSLCELKDNEYFDLLVRMAEKYALGQKGEIKLSERDLKRMPSDFMDRIAKKLPVGGQLCLSQEPAEIDGGYLLVYGGIEENCSFDALFGASREQMQDRVQKMLFPE